MPRNEKVGVGTAIAVVNNKHEVLIIKRKGAHQAEKWAFPGGWVDLTDNSLIEACRRELQEELGILTHQLPYNPELDFELLIATTEFQKELNVRTVTIYYVFRYEPVLHERPEIKEPDKCEELKWIKIKKENLPKPHFPKLEEAWEKLCKRYAK
jgi:ADP-ribose pyrophosphatase YjhB (NUDIX family)